MFNKEKLRIFLDNFPEEKREKMVEIYIKSYQKHKLATEKAIQQQDVQSLRQTLHDLKSISYTIANNELGDLAKDIEEDIDEGKDADAFKKAPGLLPHIQDILSILKGYGVKN